jgi:HK97 family phage portal protein
VGIVSKLFESRAASGSLGPPRDPVIAAWFGGQANSATGLSITPDTAMKSTVVWRCVNLLAQTFASLPLHVYREQDDGGKKLDKKHPRYKLLHDRPNVWQTSFEWREMMAGHFALRNRAYSEIVSSGGSAVASLIPLHPDRVRPFRAPDGRMAFEYYPPTGPSRIILQSEMHYLHGLALGADGVPLSPVAAREAIGLSMAAEEHSARLFGNGTRLGGILKFPAGKTLKDDPARAALLKSWKKAQSGLSNVGKTAILEDGLEWQELGMSSLDAQLLEARTFQIADIARIWGIPAHLVGDLSRSTNNNIEHQGIEFVTHTIRPGAIRWEQAIKRDIFGDDEEHCAEFNLEGLMRGDAAARSAYYASALQNSYMTPNQVRELENMNPSDSPGMDEYHIQSNMTVVDLLKQLQSASTPVKPVKKEPD